MPTANAVVSYVAVARRNAAQFASVSLDTNHRLIAGRTS
jgi:hypothetical protein